MRIARGSTPEIRISVSEDVCKLSEEANDVWLTIKSVGAEGFTKKLSEDALEIDSETNSIVCVLSQSETLSLKEGEGRGRAQIKVLNNLDYALVSQVEVFDILPVLNGEVMV